MRFKADQIGRPPPVHQRLCTFERAPHPHIWIHQLGELRHLDRAKHLDRDRGGLNLEASWTKNRKPGFQPLPARLVDELDAFSLSGAPARTLDRDLEAAGIPKHTPKGKVDFHAGRTA